MDGGRHFYKYDLLGRISKVDSESGLDGYDFYQAEYSYNENDLLQNIKGKRVMPASFEYLDTFFYDDKGLPVKSEYAMIYTPRDKEFYTIFYSYLFRK